MDYEKYFGLNDRPFKNASEAGFFYRNQAASAVFAAISDESCPPILHLKGRPGTGKTAILRRLASEMRGAFKVVVILNPHLKLSEILRRALTDLGHSHKSAPAAAEEELLGYFQNAVSDFMEEGFRLLLAVDNADELAPETLAELYGLMRLEENWAGRGVLILCGSPDAPWPMAPDFMTRLKEITIAPMDATETEAYIRHRLRAAGAAEGLFSRAALKAVWDLSGGRPDTINQLGERALIAAWSSDRKEVGAPHLRAAKASLDNPLAFNAEALERASGAGRLRSDRPPRSRVSGRLAALFLTLTFLAVLGLWRLINTPSAAAPPLEAASPPEAAGFAAGGGEAATATPAGENAVAASGGILAPALPAPPPQLLSLPQGTSVMVIDQDASTGRLWQGGRKGAGLKAEIAAPEFKAPGLYIFGRPRGRNPLVFQFPPARDIPRDEAKIMWPQVATLLPQNILPVIVAPAQAFARPKNNEMEEAVAARVKAWVQSQQYRFADTTAALYASSFQFFEVGRQARTITRENFRAALSSEARTSGDVNLTISQPLIMQDPSNNGVVWAVFNLKYESRLRDDMGTRVLVFEKSVLSQANWLIVAELWLPEKSLMGN
ncbi:MAG: AAA family ATPase [Candidatus Adiutrix sp.]|jgi:general secretion pathway protein A|nr:AAA family ATPase [Candidatus Adiutrix sp.]